jgi:hypothetical protein
MSEGAVDLADARRVDDPRAEAYAQPLETLNPAQPALFRDDAELPYFERLRAQDPIHFTAESN